MRYTGLVYPGSPLRKHVAGVICFWGIANPLPALLTVAIPLARNRIVAERSFE